jgi:hypothetical protein
MLLYSEENSEPAHLDCEHTLGPHAGFLVQTTARLGGISKKLTCVPFRVKRPTSFETSNHTDTTISDRLLDGTSYATRR